MNSRIGLKPAGDVAIVGLGEVTADGVTDPSPKKGTVASAPAGEERDGRKIQYRRLRFNW